MSRHTSTAALVSALADLREFDKRNTHLVIELRADLMNARKRLLDKISRLKPRLRHAEVFDISDYDEDVRIELLRRRSNQRLRESHNYKDAFQSMLVAAGIEI
jgi:hypothetical protein